MSRFRWVITREHTLFYLDPPYWQTAGYEAGDFPFAEYRKMCELAMTIKGRMVISINNHPDIRKVFSGLRLKVVPLRHTVDGGAGKQTNGLVYFNW